MKTWTTFVYSRLKAKKSKYTSVTATPNHGIGQTGQGIVGLEKVWSNQSKVFTIFLALTFVETALAKGGVYGKKLYKL